MLLIIFITAYGVGSQAIIDPYRELNFQTIGLLLYDIFFLPYWQMYGELSLDSIVIRDSTGCDISSDPNVTQTGICLAPDLEHIRNAKIITPVFLAVYLLIGNVMLLNLLIAIFTSVIDFNFSKVAKGG